MPSDALLTRAQGDPLRPAWHFTSPAGWLNDPNGVCTWQGRHHLFYQYNPEGAFHHRIQWGHAVSDDFLHWTDLPIALEPSDGPDVDGCWSGVLVASEPPALVYSGRHGDQELPCVAWATDDQLVGWRKSSHNPVVATRPAGLDATAFRDHCVWREGDQWRMLVGTGIRGVGGCAWLFASTDLENWDDLGPMVVGDCTGDVEALDWTGTMWECVDLFHLGDGALGEASGADVLVFSAWDEGRTLHPLYLVGRYQDGRFTAKEVHRLDLGRRHAYAPQSYLAPDGRRILWCWMQEARTDEQMLEAGWCGAMAVPRALTLVDGRIAQAPVRELAALRTDHQAVITDQVPLGGELPIDLAGTQLDLELDMAIADEGGLSLTLFGAPDGERATVLRLGPIDDDALQVVLDRAGSTTRPGIDTSPLSGVAPVLDGRIALRVLLDRSSVEVFCNGVSLTARVEPSEGDDHIRLTGQGVVLERLDAWRLSSTEEKGRVLRP
ncbi:MAG TPA: glycoside hydrolase family 32 protein, partial [Candidatus Luteococcus avicola]|nr:glycoside hydrolase family 32 protein [Candidatus Luteococcus avicola]